MRHKARYSVVYADIRIELHDMESATSALASREAAKDSKMIQSQTKSFENHYCPWS